MKCRRLAPAALAAALALAGCRGAPPAPPPVPALWEVTGPGSAHAWLFGTIHALPRGTEWRTPKLDQALGQADSLVVEIADLADAEAGARAFAAVSQSSGLLPLLQRMAPDQRPALAAALKRAGLSESQFAGTETWAAALAIANAEQTGDAENGVDRALLARGLPVTALESFAEQFAIFDGLPAQDQADLLHLAAEESAPAEDARMTAAWRAGDLQALSREADKGVLADPELREALLTARNVRWAERIAALLAQGKHPLVAVGAAHMLGPGGLPARLAARGFTVRRIQ